MTMRIEGNVDLREDVAGGREIVSSALAGDNGRVTIQPGGSVIAIRKRGQDRVREP
jgi:hypothetical protein